MSLGEFVAWFAICGGCAVLALARWADALLADEGRYVHAVRGLPASRVARRFTPLVVAAVARRRGVPQEWASGLGRHVARLASGRLAGVAWVGVHRRLHRTRRADWRLTAVMLTTAAAGQLCGGRQRSRSAPRTT